MTVQASETSRLMDMRDCTRREWLDINKRIWRLQGHLQPAWLRPFLQLPWLHRRLSPRGRQWEYPWAVLSADLQPDMRVLDVGSGGSSFTLFLASEGLDVHAVDPSLGGGVELAEVWSWRWRAARALGIATEWGLPPRALGKDVRVTYARYRVQKLGYGNCSFDRVFCLSVMEHIPQRERAESMTEMCRVLRDGGRLIMTLDMTTRDGNERQYRCLLTSARLRLVGNVDYAVPISAEDKRARHPGQTHETLGLILEKV